MKKVFLVFLAAAMLALAPAAFGGELPRLSVSYIFTTHQEPFMVALARGEAFADSGVYLKPVVAKEKYDLMVEGNAVARLSVIVAKSGAETSTLFAQKHLDIGLGSLPAMMTAIDKGLPIKVLCPVHTEGMGLVVAPANPVSDWNSFLAWVKGAKQKSSIRPALWVTVRRQAGSCPQRPANFCILLHNTSSACTI